MPDSSSLSARAVAAEVLRQFDSRHAYAGPILNRLLSRTSEKQRATDLVFGTIRNLLAIDTVITEFSGRRIERIAKPLLAVIRIGVYELIYCPDSPPYSIVNEAVNTAKHTGGRKQTGFVNAVLRAVLRHIVERWTERATAGAKRTLPQNFENGCAFDTDFLPDPETDLASYLGVSFSLPLWLVEEWLDAFGPERTRDICFGCNRRPSVYVRVNPLKTTEAALLERLTTAGIQAEQVPGIGPGMHGGLPLRITAPQSVAQLPGFAEGWFTVQDIAASNAVRLLDPQPGWTILDLCAAPGTKTTQLAEWTHDEAQIVATDIDTKRLTKLDENLARLGLKSVTVTQTPKAFGMGPIGPTSNTEGVRTFDAVLLDVPCSNTGVLAKRIEVRFRITPPAVKKLIQTQRDLLEKAVPLVKPGGRICYSTCSIQRAENADLVRTFLEAHPQFELACEELILPSAVRATQASPRPFDHDGAYAAILVKHR
jgi:16S rRNA (cytosine967-C5)-methyltransferase